MIRKIRLALRHRFGNAAQRVRRVARNLERAFFFQHDERDSAQDRD
jgi:hypothetical protein